MQFQEATSLNNYGPSIPQLECLALSSHDPGKFRDLVYVMDKRLNDHGKNWRHVFKTLVVLEYRLVCGSEQVVDYAMRTLPAIRTLTMFQYIDYLGRDTGQSGTGWHPIDFYSLLCCGSFPRNPAIVCPFCFVVRQKAGELVALLTDHDQFQRPVEQSASPRT